MGSVQVTWTATDDTGNTASAIQIVTVQDTMAPSLTPPADVLAEAESSNGASADIGIAVAEDIGDVEISNNAPEIFPLGETQVTWTATDASGNVASAIQTVMISDTVAPVITAPVTITVEAESAKSTSVSLSDPHTIDISGHQISHQSLAHRICSHYLALQTLHHHRAKETSDLVVQFHVWNHQNQFP